MVIIIAGLAAAVRLRLRRTLLRMISLLLLSAVAYLLATTLLPGRLLMGGCFALLLLNTGLVGLNALGQSRPKAIGAAALLLPALFGLAPCPVPAAPVRIRQRSGQDAETRGSEHVSGLRSNIGPGTAIVLYGGDESDDAINVPVLEYLARKDERNGFEFLQASTNGTLPARSVVQSNCVIVCKNLRSAGLMTPKEQQAILRSPDFEPVAVFPISSSESYSLLKRVPDFTGFDQSDGLGPPEGPYADWSLDRPVRWGLGPQSVIQFAAARPSFYRIYVDVRTSRQDQRMTLTIDGAVVADRLLKQDAWEKFDMPFDLSAGRHELRCIYQPPGKLDASGRALAVLFRSLHRALRRIHGPAGAITDQCRRSAGCANFDLSFQPIRKADITRLNMSASEGPLAAGISIIVPVYNSEETLEPLAERLEPVLRLTGKAFELILINDGSRDRSWEAIDRLVASRAWVRGIDLMRNHGQHNALLCGIRAAHLRPP